MLGSLGSSSARSDDPEQAQAASSALRTLLEPSRPHLRSPELQRQQSCSARLQRPNLGEALGLERQEKKKKAMRMVTNAARCIQRRYRHRLSQREEAATRVKSAIQIQRSYRGSARPPIS